MECFRYFDLLFLSLLFKFIVVAHALQRSLVYVIIKESDLSQSIFEDHEAEAGLNSVLPEASVDTAIKPIHLTISFFKIIFIVAFVFTARAPNELSVSMLLIQLVVALIRI